MPEEPPPTSWVFPDPAGMAADGLVGVGADLEPGTVLAAYRRGIFPWPVPGARRAWWSPDPRAVLPFDRVHVPKSLARTLRAGRYEVRADTAFDEVIAACAQRRDGGTWITAEMRRAYTELHRLGWVHSVEAWAADGTLAGGLYGVAIGGFFAGESMFHRRTDASKVALVGLVERLRTAGFALLDVQFRTEHLARFGAVEMPRAEYLERLETALRLPVEFPPGR